MTKITRNTGVICYDNNDHPVIYLFNVTATKEMFVVYEHFERVVDYIKTHEMSAGHWGFVPFDEKDDIYKLISVDWDNAIKVSFSKKISS